MHSDVGGVSYSTVLSYSRQATVCRNKVSRPCGEDVGNSVPWETFKGVLDTNKVVVTVVLRDTTARLNSRAGSACDPWDRSYCNKIEL